MPPNKAAKVRVKSKGRVNKRRSATAVKPKTKRPIRFKRGAIKPVTAKFAPNQPFIIHESVSILIVSVVALFGFVAMRQTSMATTDIEEVVAFAPHQWYTNTTGGWRVRLPLDWQVDEYSVQPDERKYQAVVASSADGQRLVIYTLPAEMMESLPETAHEFWLKKLPAKEFSDGTWGTGVGTERLVINRQDGYVDEIVGSGAAFYEAKNSYTYLGLPQF